MFGRYWAESQVLAEVCAKALNETGTLIGTAFTARDTMRVVDALNEDGLLRFWGELIVQQIRSPSLTSCRFFRWYYSWQSSYRHVSRKDR
jgi:hypothetical protein